MTELPRRPDQNSPLEELRIEPLLRESVTEIAEALPEVKENYLAIVRNGQYIADTLGIPPSYFPDMYTDECVTFTGLALHLEKAWQAPPEEAKRITEFVLAGAQLLADIDMEKPAFTPEESRLGYMRHIDHKLTAALVQKVEEDDLLDPIRMRLGKTPETETSIKIVALDFSGDADDPESRALQHDFRLTTGSSSAISGCCRFINDELWIMLDKGVAECLVSDTPRPTPMSDWHNPRYDRKAAIKVLHHEYVHTQPPYLPIGVGGGHDILEEMRAVHLSGTSSYWHFKEVLRATELLTGYSVTAEIERTRCDPNVKDFFASVVNNLGLEHTLYLTNINAERKTPNSPQQQILQAYLGGYDNYLQKLHASVVADPQQAAQMEQRLQEYANQSRYIWTNLPTMQQVLKPYIVKQQKQK